MSMSSPEQDLILILMGDIYKMPNISIPKKIDWDKFLRLASLNKVSYYAVMKMMEDHNLDIEPEILKQAAMLRELEKEKLAKLGPSLEVAESALGQEPHLLSKTYRGYPHVTHDIDFLVHDLKKAQILFEKNGHKPLLWWDKRSFEVVEEGLLEIEIYDKISPGPYIFIDDSVVWSGNREAVIEGIKVRLPSIEADIMTYLADMSFRIYEILMGDVVYLYQLSAEADWKLMAEQAKKHNWLEQFDNMVAILNGLHRRLYGEASPMEEYLPTIAQVDLDFPYILSFPQVTRNLLGKGAKNLVKLPGYYSVRLKKGYPRLHKIYSKLVLVYLGQILGKYVYRS
ncbi:putative nucleotidyltransferase [uncultured archaeon]|nr:putative nucleotidyltransferase [uncultured archaeon]